MKILAETVDKDHCDYFTEGKVYEAKALSGFTDYVYVVADNGQERVVNLAVSSCFHTNGTWGVVEQ